MMQLKINNGTGASVGVNKSGGVNNISINADSGERQNLIFTADAEDAAFSNLNPVPFDVYSAPLSTSFTRVTTNPGSGTHCYKAIVNKTDSNFAGGKRAEVNLFSEVTTGDGYNNFERMFGFKFRLDSTFTHENLSPNVTTIICQFHDNEQGGETGFKSAWELHLCDDKMSYTVRSCATENNGDIQERLAQDYITPGAGSHMNASNPVINQNQWYDIVVHLKFSNPAGGTPNAGVVEIWIDGVLCGEYSGPMGYNHTYSPFLKMGLYCYYWNDGSYEGFVIDTTKIAYYDEARYGNEDATYSDVAPDIET